MSWNAAILNTWIHLSWLRRLSVSKINTYLASTLRTFVTRFFKWNWKLYPWGFILKLHFFVSPQPSYTIQNKEHHRMLLTNYARNYPGLLRIIRDLFSRRGEKGECSSVVILLPREKQSDVEKSWNLISTNDRCVSKTGILLSQRVFFSSGLLSRDFLGCQVRSRVSVSALQHWSEISWNEIWSRSESQKSFLNINFIQSCCCENIYT